MVRNVLVQSYFDWTYHGADNTPLWSFSVKHAVWLHNHFPNYLSGITPLELRTSNKADHRNLIISHVWVCPVFVLDPKLQNDQKIPKWNRRSILGQFIGFLEHHSSLIASILHINTGQISPQYHVVFDELFETVYSTGENDPNGNTICKKLC